MSRFDRRLVADLTTLSVLMLFLLLAACGRTTGSAQQAIVVMASATANEPGPVLASGDAALLYHAGAISTDVVAYVMDPNTGQQTRVPLTPRRPDGQVDWGPGRGERLAGNVSRVQQLLNREAATKPFDLLAEISAARRVTNLFGLRGAADRLRRSDLVDHVPNPSFIGVRTGPGATALTRTPEGRIRQLRTWSTVRGRPDLRRTWSCPPARRRRPSC
jgi:hypothetical protein